jgi:hypothetical protein
MLVSEIVCLIAEFIYSELKGKKVYGLHLEQHTLQTALNKLSELIPKLALHIFTAHHQWHAHECFRANLGPHCVITVEDYQMNLEVVYREAPTSLAFSANKLGVAVYPVCVEYLDLATGTVKKGAIVFLSGDRKHDHHQVTAFEQRLFSILRTQLGREIANWARFTDGAASQYRSRFVTAKLLSAQKDFGLQNVAYHYYEAHEGKNVSDSIGSIVKCAYLRAMANSDLGVSSAAEVITIIKTALKEKTTNFEFFILEEFGQTARLDGKEKKIEKILTIHSLAMGPSGVVARQFSCLDCSVAQLCDNCLIATPAAVADAPEEQQEEEEVIIQDMHDDGDSADDLTDDDADEDADTFGPGTVVWAKYGRRWLPGKICGLTDIPAELQGDRRMNVKSGKVIVRWYEDDTYTPVNENNLCLLATNALDTFYAEVDGNDAIRRQYNQALVDLEYGR